MKFQGDADTRVVCIKIYLLTFWGWSFRGDDLLIAKVDTQAAQPGVWYRSKYPHICEVEA